MSTARAGATTSRAGPAQEVASIPDDGSDADLAAVCTISVTELQKAALAAFAEE